MKIVFIDNTPHIIPENYHEEDVLFNFYEKNKQKAVGCCIGFEWVEKNSSQEKVNDLHEPCRSKDSLHNHP